MFKFVNRSIIGINWHSKPRHAQRECCRRRQRLGRVMTAISVAGRSNKGTFRWESPSAGRRPSRNLQQHNHHQNIHSDRPPLLMSN